MEYEVQLRREAKKLFREQGTASKQHYGQRTVNKNTVWSTGLRSYQLPTANAMPFQTQPREIEQLKKQVAEGQIQVATGSQRIQKKFSEVNWHHKTLQHSLRTKEKEDEPKVTKITKVAVAKERVNILVHLLNSSTKVGTRFSTSTTRRNLDSVSLPKADLERNRSAGSTTAVQVATKWVYRTTIALPG